MKKDNWSSEFGFLMAAAGSAVGLGNIWKFPYVAGMNGGALFIIVYFILLVIMGMPVLLSEMSIGRFAGKNPVDSCKTINSKWSFAGAFGIIGSFVVLCYYSVIGGWIIKYLLAFITGEKITDPQAYFSSFTEKAVSPVIFHILFTALCIFIVMRGISGGIEKVSSVFMPALIILIIILMIKALTLKGSYEGVKFFIIPDLAGSPPLINVIINAMGQVFFSLSLGMGTLITYGSYLDKSVNLKKSTAIISIIDFFIALLAGLTVMPAVFAYGIEPQAGSGLIFIALTQVFSQMAGGRIFGILFFLSVLFAAVTSAISLFEAIIAFFMQKLNMSRILASLISAAGVSIVGIPASLSFGAISHIKISGMNFFDFLNFISDKILMPLGAFSICILSGYIWKNNGLAREAGLSKGFVSKFFIFSVKYIAPVLIIFIFISSFIF